MSNSAKIVELLQYGESQTIEFKSSFDRETIETLVSFANDIYNCIKQNPGLRLPELSKLSGTSLKTLERWIKQLRDEGKIVYKGAPKTGGYHIA